MKKLLFIAVLLICLSATAQKGKWERIKALKVAFITEKLDLSEKESQEFWPVYNAFEEKTNTIRHKEMKSLRKEIRENTDTMSDNEALVLIERFRKAENEMHRLRIEFSEKLSKIIPPKKIIKLRLAEEDFRQQMFEEYKKRRKERG
ncbi:sensor of ECF-type sigma factor [Hyunsoonleella sp. SJ7]|uniref:Sensor of ECF-type sigma factor n=1 Tax=Hyunsoonleella aquatilis TaxID=2762758 RepID=A0A923H720_9FLAO|nr:sensor of ECF-type sigma factor [Hyunsoonleella aquatilis]MBC3757651.1 sensor of ECF-type sigma factor [Hyunsoonleella aquatilis]